MWTGSLSTTKSCGFGTAGHLNDMRAGCEHQRAENWGDETLEVVSYKLTAEAIKIRKGAEAKSTNAAIASQAAELSETERALLSLDWWRDVYSPPDADSPLSGMYEVSKRESKRASWVNPHEHPRGVLCKPCPVCGYKFGMAWLFEEVPTEVLDFLRSLPDNAKEMPATWRRTS